ncbi:hypothetical protein [Endomicrobium proavitum]|uniref:PorV/PorQ family protein n=1 Tax=Endomicrobium proavitum TaxID=1408281 RepID=A0A0G3WK07_9BACT|nr:hypothetical protein [Endomicrobium proavitum]AKL97839.1 exported protein of unknown function [Endomicrobium proavitum]
MNIAHILVVFFLLSAFTVCNVFAKSAPVSANSYDGFAPSARTMAMGSAGAGLLSADKDSFYYNPANLANFQGSFLNANAVFSIKSNANSNDVAINNPSGQGLTSAFLVKDSGSFFWESLSDNSVIFDANSHAEISISRIGVSFAKQGSAGASQAISLSYLYGKIGYAYLDPLTGQNADIISGNGFSIDYSLLFNLSKNINLGINLKNIVAFMFWNDYGYQQQPFTIRAGLGYNLKGLSMALDWDKKYYRSGNLEKNALHFGIEQYLTNFLCVRAGIENNFDFLAENAKYSLGLGFKIKNIEISCAALQQKISKQDFYKAAVSVRAVI